MSGTHSLSGYVTCTVASYSLKHILPEFGKKLSQKAVKAALAAGKPLEFLHAMGGYFNWTEAQAAGATNLMIRYNQDRDQMNIPVPKAVSK